MSNLSRAGQGSAPTRTRLGLLGGLLFAALCMITSPARAQQLTGTLTGTVYDQSGATVPRANVVLKNQASGDERALTTQEDGHFVITALQPATYSIQVAAPGFSSWRENDIVINQGDNRDVTNIKLKIGGNSTQIEVISGADAVVPLDTAEVSTSLNATMIDQFPLAGRDAGELLKIMPGMALNNGGSQGSSFQPKVVGSNNGPVGAYSANGTQPNGAMAFMLDGANLVDPGNFGTQIANINQDMVASVKVLMSSYGAEYAKGPTIFQAFSKSGGSSFHGMGYLYTHNSVLDATDSYTKSQGLTQGDQHYYYAGGNVGGPVILPFVKFNRDRKSLFFWAGYEYMSQHPAATPINFNVPNAAQLSGDFSNTGVPAGAINQWQSFYTPPTNNLPTGATSSNIPTSNFDPNILGILKLYPKTNETPNANNGYNNYLYVNNNPQNRWEVTAKADYAIGDNTKITASYSRQKETDIHPIDIWWQAPWTLPYPSNAVSPTVTNMILTNFTHVFSATTTNEFVFTYAHFVNPSAFTNPSATTRATNGFNVPGLFGHTTKQIPNFEGPWGGALANISQYSLESGSFGGTKQDPAVYDNFTKVIGNHALKFGGYWDTSENKQNSTSPENGTYTFGGQFSTGNQVADLELGRINNYNQTNNAPVTDVKFHQWSFYGQDQWKAARQLTVNLGLRFDHLGQWYGVPPGYQIFDGSLYDNSPGAAPNTGLRWHAIDHSIPVSGFKSPFVYISPRVGLAYDVFGTGKTVFRGGIAMFRYQLTSETASAGAGPLGQINYYTPTAFEGYANVSTFTPPSSVAQNGSTVYAMQRGDDRTPFTTDWNATVSQALPWRSVVEISYVANRSANEYIDGSNGKLYDLNNTQKNAYFAPDPLTGKYVSPAAPGCSTDITKFQQNPIDCSVHTYANFNNNDFRPLRNYQDVYLLTHGGWSKYNSFQASFQKQSGPVTFVTNYTFSKVLGTRDGGSNNGPGNGTAEDPFSLRANYGPLAYDHTHIVNLSYSWNLPKPIKNNRILEGAINGWQLSGYTAYQSGAPLQPSLNGSMNAQYPGKLSMPTNANPTIPDNSITLPNGLKAIGVNPSVWFGSNSYNILIPALTCDPSKHLASGQRFRPQCFTTPAFGQQGPLNYPYLRNPGYFQSDLGVYKNFKVGESQKISIRAYANNFLNHALPQFGLANQSDEQLNFTQYLAVGQALSPTNTNTTTTGKPQFRTGSRSVTLAAKYYF